MRFCCSGHWGISDFVLISSTWTLALNFFLDLVAEMIYREIAAVFFQYLVMFKLNFKPGCCCSILGPAANQKRFKYTSQQCKVYHVLRQESVKIWRQTLHKWELLWKVLNIQKNTWQNYCTKTILHGPWDDF